jgi:hypothetical protein
MTRAGMCRLGRWAMGVDPNQPLRPEQRTALIQAMGQFENGRPISAGSPSQAMGLTAFQSVPMRRGFIAPMP